MNNAKPKSVDFSIKLAFAPQPDQLKAMNKANARPEKLLPLESGLYVTATPIGNLGDITIRAIETLKQAELILCEDTRQTARLCQAYQIQTKRQAYHDHNGAAMRPMILQRLLDGAAICLVSDAGTPLISDPGYKLVKEAKALNIPVTAIPGACAAITALSIAGLPSDQFMFAGFPPAKSEARKKFFETLLPIKTSLIFYESASRLQKCLEAMALCFGDREVVVARELTKKFEQVCAGQLKTYAEDMSELTLKGEIVILLGPPGETVENIDIEALLNHALQTMSVKEAATAIASSYGIPRRDVYSKALQLRNKENAQS